MENHELYHYGRKGMKWYQNIFSKKKGGTSRKNHSDENDVETKIQSSKKSSKEERKSVKKMTTEELHERIKRLEMEKQYKKLMQDTDGVTRGKNFVLEILEQSGKNILIQGTTYAFGTILNKTVETITGQKNIVNPKKGQKEK